MRIGNALPEGLRVRALRLHSRGDGRCDEVLRPHAQHHHRQGHLQLQHQSSTETQFEWRRTESWSDECADAVSLCREPLPRRPLPDGDVRLPLPAQPRGDAHVLPYTGAHRRGDEYGRWQWRRGWLPVLAHPLPAHPAAAAGVRDHRWAAEPACGDGGSTDVHALLQQLWLPLCISHESDTSVPQRGAAGQWQYCRVGRVVAPGLPLPPLSQPQPRLQQLRQRLRSYRPLRPAAAVGADGQRGSGGI